MKINILIANFLALIPCITCAQSLDVGGVNLTLGQNESDVIKNLGRFYSLPKSDESVINITWRSVLDKNGNQIGGFEVRNGVLTVVQKIYDLQGSNNSFSTIYAIGSAEVENKGGKNCRFKEHSQDPQKGMPYIHYILKQCGSYRLILSLPYNSRSEQSKSPSLTLTLLSPKIFPNQ
jgi:hypothetical protein